VQSVTLLEEGIVDQAIEVGPHALMRNNSNEEDGK
jgi:hypothetical protein